MYDTRHGVAQDNVEAMKRFRKAAEQGYARARYNLGFMFGKGRGVPQDYAEASFVATIGHSLRSHLGNVGQASAGTQVASGVPPA